MVSSRGGAVLWRELRQMQVHIHSLALWPTKAIILFAQQCWTATIAKLQANWTLQTSNVQNNTPDKQQSKLQTTLHTRTTTTIQQRDTRPLVRGGRGRPLGNWHPKKKFLCSFVVLWHSPSMFLHEWTSQQLGIWVPYSYDSLHLHSCMHVNNMTLTDTADTNCQNSYYGNEYLFDIATSNQRIYTHKLNSLHQIKTSTKDKTPSWFWQSTCSTVCNQTALCESILFAIYLHTICNQIALCILLLLAIFLLRNLQSVCSLHTSTTGIQIDRNLQSVGSLHITTTGVQIARNLRSVCSSAYNYYWYSNCPQLEIQ